MLLGLIACGGPRDADQATDPASPNADPQTVTSPTKESPQQPAGTSALQDTVVVPGERVGPITSKTSRDDLAKIFGEKSLTDKDINVGEGTMEPGTVINLPNDQGLTVIWTDKTRSKPQLVQDLGAAWKTSEGLGKGSSMAELKEKLGDFQLYGFGWDYGGSIVLESTKLDKYYGNLFFRVQPPKDKIDQHPDAYKALQGDKLFQSTDPNMEPLEPVVTDTMVYLNPLSE